MARRRSKTNRRWCLVVACALFSQAADPARASHAHLNYMEWWKPAYETPVITAPAPSGLNSREQAFASRNQPDNIRALSSAFFSQIDLNRIRIQPDYVRLDSWGRNEMRWSPPPAKAASIKELLAVGKDQEALDAYREFFFRRLSNPPPSYPIEPVHPLKRHFIEFIHEPDELLHGNVARFTMLDRQNKGAVVRIDIGEPGRVNWTFVPKEFHAYDDLIFPPDVNFMVACAKQPHFFDTLLNAYMESGKKEYLEKWAAFQEDRILNFERDAAALSTRNQSTAASSVSGGAAPSISSLSLYLTVFNHLAYVARHRPEVAHDLPSATLARMMMKMWEGAPIGLRATRAASNNRSIQMYPEPMFLAGVAFPEFKQSDYYIRERLRTLETYPVTTMMPDGSDIENEIGYNRAYLLAASEVRRILMESPSLRPPRVDAQWLATLRENLALRAKFLLLCKLNNGRDLYPSYYRVSKDFSGPNPNLLSIVPEFLADPLAKQVISQEFGEGNDAKPPFRSVSWPYAGKYLIRSGWDQDAQQLYMQSPRPYSTHTWKNANDIQLYAFGQPLLTYQTEGYGYRRSGYEGDGVYTEWEDGYRDELKAKYKDKNPNMHGLYQWEFTPVFVDGCPQLGHETYAKLPEKMRLDPAPTYGRGAQMAYPTPLKNRWHESDRFTFAEGEYSGPFAQMDGSKFIYDVAHRRQVLFCREAGVWIVWDRLSSPSPHQYRLEWKFAQPFELEKKQIPGFLPEQIHSEKDGKILRTANPDAANLTIAMESASHLTPAGTGVSFSGEGTVLSFLYPRRNIGTDLTEISPLKLPKGQSGLRAVTPDGYRIETVTSTAPDAKANGEASDLHAEPMRIKAQTLVLVTAPDKTKSGIVLGSHSPVNAGNGIQTRDFEFDLDQSGPRNIRPIFTPLERPAILPAANQFDGELTVTLTHPAKDVQLRYTLDGTDPGLDSPLYQKPFIIRQSTVVRARAFRIGLKEMPATPDGVYASAPLEADYVRRASLPPSTVAETKPGLAYEYYEGDWSLWAQTPPGEKPKATGVVNALFETPQPKAHKGRLYIYEGFLNIPKDGVYTFHAPPEFITPPIDAGYDLRLWIGKEEWYPSVTWHNFGNWSIPLKKGLHPLHVAFVDWRESGMPGQGLPWTGERPRLEFSGPGIPKAPLPSAMLCHQFHQP